MSELRPENDPAYLRQFLEPYYVRDVERAEALLRRLPEHVSDVDRYSMRRRSWSAHDDEHVLNAIAAWSRLQAILSEIRATNGALYQNLRIESPLGLHSRSVGWMLGASASCEVSQAEAESHAYWLFLTAAAVRHNLLAAGEELTLEKAAVLEHLVRKPVAGVLADETTLKPVRPGAKKQGGGVKGKNVDELLRQWCIQNPERRDWSSRDIAKALGCVESTLVETPYWQGPLQEWKDRERAERAKRGEKVDRRKNPRKKR